VANYNGNYSFSAVDDAKVRAAVTLPMRFAEAATLTQIVAGWTGALAVLQPIMGASIDKGTISFSQVVASPPSPVADSRVEQNGVFNFAISGTSHRQGIAVASLLDTLIDAGVIDLAAPVATFTDLISAAITGGGVYATPDGVALGALVDAFLSFRKHRRQLRAHSLELA
jgi:hypothetical protein